jgi:hypothetical protein
VASLNKDAQSLRNITAIPNDLIEKSDIQKSMLFEVSVIYVENILKGNSTSNWDSSLLQAAKRQQRHYDSVVPSSLTQLDISIAKHAANNLYHMLMWIQQKTPQDELIIEPEIPGMGWIASGNGDFSLGNILIEVKHTDRNFSSRDFRQILIYLLLKYSYAIEKNEKAWEKILLLNPRRNYIVFLDFDHIISSASTNSNRIELLELLRSIVNPDIDRR